MNYKNTITSDNYNFKVQNFASIYDFTSYLDSATLSPIFKYEDLDSIARDYNGGWSGTKTYEEAQELLSHGWLPEAAALAKKVPLSSTLSTAAKRTNIYSTVGFQASVPRYLQGIPSNMINQHRTVQKQKIIILNRSIAFNSNWSAAKIEAEGVKALQVVKALEGNGFRVKLNVVALHYVSSWSGGYGGKTQHDVAAMTICIKKPDEPLNISKIAFPMAHPAMLRRLDFKWLESFQEFTNKDITSGYGSAEVRLYSKIMPKGEHLMPNEIGDIERYVKSLLQ